MFNLSEPNYYNLELKEISKRGDRFYMLTFHDKLVYFNVNHLCCVKPVLNIELSNDVFR